MNKLLCVSLLLAAVGAISAKTFGELLAQKGVCKKLAASQIKPEGFAGKIDQKMYDALMQSEAIWDQMPPYRWTALAFFKCFDVDTELKKSVSDFIINNEVNIGDDAIGWLEDVLAE